MAELLAGMPAAAAGARDPYHDAKSRLQHLVAGLAARGEGRLPSEDQLSAELGVSRATLRSALLSLQMEGKVQRVHGRGTFINRHAVRIAANLAEDRPFVDLLRDVGHDPTVASTVQPVTDLAGALCALLGWDGPRPVVPVERVFRVAGAPAVYLVDHVPVDLLVTDVDGLTGEDSSFAFLARHTGYEVRYSVADIVPVTADETVAACLEVDLGHPLLLLLHTHLDVDDRPLAVTQAFVNDRYLKFSVVRTYRDA